MRRFQVVQTPWGAAQGARQVAEGVVRYDTASHGGYWLDEARQAQVVAQFPEFRTFAGGPWYEEDQDWAIVALVFPELFPPDAQEHARSTVEHSVLIEQELYPSRPSRWQGVLVRLQAVA